MFGNLETTTGGRALKFYSTIRIDVRRVDTLKNGNDMITSGTRVKIVKIKSLRRSNKQSLDIMYGEGISTKVARLIWVLNWKSSTRAVLGIPTVMFV